MYKYKILIVDDEYLILQRLTEVINWDRYGFSLCGGAQDAVEAMEAIREQVPDLVLTDIRMPEIDGLELCRWIKEQYPLTRIIILTGHQEFDYAQRAIHLGVDDFLIKPIDEDKLADSLHKVYQLLEANRLSNLEFALTEPANDVCQDAAERLWRGLLDHSLEDMAEVLKSIDESPVRYRERLIQLAYQLTDNLIRLKGYSFEYLTKPVQMRHRLLLEVNVERMNGVFSAYMRELLFDLEESYVNQNDAIYQCVLQYVADHYAENVGLAEMSQYMGYNQAYLSRVIKKQSGRGFTEILTDHRMEKAKEMLSKTEYKVRTIAEQVGFHDVKYFCRLFKKRVGTSPKTYRAHTR